MIPDRPPADPPRTRTTPEQLILDLASMWLDRYDRAQHLPRGSVFDPRDPAEAVWRATAASLVDAWTSLYLLAQLREHAPQVAEHAAQVLTGSTPALSPERMPVYVRAWATTVADGRSLLPLGLLP